MTIEVKHQVPVTVETTYVELPYYFTTDYYTHAEQVFAIREDFSLTTVYFNDGYVSMSVKMLGSEEKVSEFLESHFKSNKVTQITKEQFKETLTKSYNAISKAQ